MSHPQAEAKWSPAALERQMAAELARLESLGDSLQQLSSMERTRAVALAQQETVSLAQILKVSEIPGCGRLKPPAHITVVLGRSHHITASKDPLYRNSLLERFSLNLLIHQCKIFTGLMHKIARLRQIILLRMGSLV